MYSLRDPAGCLGPAFCTGPKERLALQSNKCAGCGSALSLSGLGGLLGGNVRLCAYTSFYFCKSCHVNERAVLPVRVLHHWDYTPYKVH